MAISTDKPESSQGLNAPIADNVKALIESAGQSAAIPHFYFNGFIMAQGTGDVTLILQLNNQPVAAVNCSFTVAKTLSQNLGIGIKHLETMSGREIMTTEDIARMLSKTRTADAKSSPTE